MIKHTKCLVSKKLVMLDKLRVKKHVVLQSRGREIVLVPQELIILNDTASDVKQRFALELSCDGMDPGSGSG